MIRTYKKYSYTVPAKSTAFKFKVAGAYNDHCCLSNEIDRSAI